MLFSDVFDVITWQRVCKRWRQEINERVLASFLEPHLKVLCSCDLDRSRMLLENLKNSPFNMKDPRVSLATFITFSSNQANPHTLGSCSFPRPEGEISLRIKQKQLEAIYASDKLVVTFAFKRFRSWRYRKVELEERIKGIKSNWIRSVDLSGEKLLLQLFAEDTNLHLLFVNEEFWNGILKLFN